MASPFYVKCLRVVARCVFWFGRHFLKWNRLEKVELIDLDAPIDDAVSMYGDPIDSEPDETVPDAIEHVFYVGPFHKATVVEWKGRVCLVSYWSAYADPDRDLKCMLDKYGNNIGWEVLEPGYLCIRRDRKVLLRCSVAPILCVETMDYFDARRAASESA